MRLCVIGLLLVTALLTCEGGWDSSIWPIADHSTNGSMFATTGMYFRAVSDLASAVQERAYACGYSPLSTTRQETVYTGMYVCGYFTNTVGTNVYIYTNYCLGFEEITVTQLVNTIASYSDLESIDEAIYAMIPLFVDSSACDTNDDFQEWFDQTYVTTSAIPFLSAQVPFTNNILEFPMWTQTGIFTHAEVGFIYDKNTALFTRMSNDNVSIPIAEMFYDGSWSLVSYSQEIETATVKYGGHGSQSWEFHSGSTNSCETSGMVYVDGYYWTGSNIDLTYSKPVTIPSTLSGGGEFTSIFAMTSTIAACTGDTIVCKFTALDIFGEAPYNIQTKILDERRSIINQMKFTTQDGQFYNDNSNAWESVVPTCTGTYVTTYSSWTNGPRAYWGKAECWDRDGPSTNYTWNKVNEWSLKGKGQATPRVFLTQTNISANVDLYMRHSKRDVENTMRYTAAWGTYYYPESYQWGSMGYAIDKYGFARYDTDIAKSNTQTNVIGNASTMAYSAPAVPTFVPDEQKGTWHYVPSSDCCQLQDPEKDSWGAIKTCGFYNDVLSLIKWDFDYTD